ncbi:MAG: hypothetical protein OEU36_25135 [Gammaproteobacteria bacterium]|nr:hypothetical protein [Gammaproteobacteria bacterium]
MKILASLLFFIASVAHGSQATIVGLYQDCKYAGASVFIDKGVLPEQQAMDVTAEIQLLTVGASFRDTVNHGVERLKQHGIVDVEVRETGSVGCSTRISGYFVQAVGNYCNEQLVSAEIRVDGEVFSKQDRPTISFQDFVSHSVTRLRDVGIWDQPRVVVRSQGACS